MSQKCFSHQIESYTATLSFFFCFEVFLQNKSKNLSFMSKKCFSQQIEPHTGVFLFKMRKIQLIEAYLLY